LSHRNHSGGFFVVWSKKIERISLSFHFDTFHHLFTEQHPEVM